MHVKGMVCCHSLFLSSPWGSSSAKTHSSINKTQRFNRCFSLRRRFISCRFEDPSSEDDRNKNYFHLLQVSVTLTVVSASLPKPSFAAKPAPKKSSRKVEAVTLEELTRWSDGLPVVEERLPYTELLNLKEEGRLKHVIKHPKASLREDPTVVLVVLDDSRVLRTVLPSSDDNFWRSWTQLGMDSVCVHAFSPPFKEEELPASYLPNVWSTLNSLISLFRKKSESKTVRKHQGKNEMRREKVKEVIDDREKMMKLKLKQKESVAKPIQGSVLVSDIWGDMATDPFVTTSLGFLFFYIFYRIVVLGYRKRKKDYEDRVKIEKAEEFETRGTGIEIEGIEDELTNEGEKQSMQEKLAKKFLQSGARVHRAKGGRRPPQYLERGVNVKFSDVAGLGKIRLELEEIIKFFTHKEVYLRRGVKIPGGILLCGPPGVGKTLLAKAVAGEAAVNYFSISASQFVEIYVGVGASRVRTLYQEAKENAPSVVFIDELDAVGRKRGLITGSGGQERDATLNQLLVCLDGFEGRGDVITIASTNRPDILDPALIRPGRFDRKIHIPKPSLIGRIEILQVHAQRKPMAADVDYLAIANVTDGMVGAELANVVEVAALQMIRDGRTQVTTDDLLQAVLMEERGMLDKVERSADVWRQVAIHEAATAVVAVNLPELRSIEFITISPRAGNELGYVRFRSDPVKVHPGMISRRTFTSHITVRLASRAADELLHGTDQMSTISARSVDGARSMARVMVLSGLTERDCGIANFYTEERTKEIDTETRVVLDRCYQHAKEILARNDRLMDALVDALVARMSITKKDFLELVALYGSPVPSPPGVIDICRTMHPSVVSFSVPIS